MRQGLLGQEPDEDTMLVSSKYVRLFLQGARHLPKEAAHPAGHRDEPREPRLPRTRVQGAPPHTDLPHQLQV